MNINDFPIVGPAVDMEQVPAINYKRTLAFMNHFVTHTVRFLNKFSGVCEQMKLKILVIFACLLSYSHAAGCGQTTFKATSDVIVSPRVGQSSQTCEYTIDVSHIDRWLRLRFTEFDMDGKMPNCNDGSYIEVFIGCSSSMRSVSKFCSANMDGAMPHPIFSRDGCITIKYYNSIYSTSGGFKADYTSYYKTVPKYSTSCFKSLDVEQDSGTIISPNWPLPYKPQKFPFTNKCEWKIKTKDSKKVTKVNVMDLDMYMYTDSSTSCSPDKLTIEGKDSSLTSDKRKLEYCSKETPFSLETFYYNLDVEVKVSNHYSYKNRGFVLGYVSYIDDEASKAAEKSRVWYIIGIVVVAVFVLLCCCFCVYRRRKRQQPHSTVTTSTTTTTAGGYGRVPSLQNTQQTNVTTNYPQQYPPAQPTYPPVQPAAYPQQTQYPYPAQTQQTAGYPPQYQYPPNPGYPATGQQAYPAYPPETKNPSAPAADLSSYDQPPPPYPGLAAPPYPG